MWGINITLFDVSCTYYFFITDFFVGFKWLEVVLPFKTISKEKF